MATAIPGATRTSRRRRFYRRNRPLVMLGVIILVIILVTSVLPIVVIAFLRHVPRDLQLEHSTAPAETRAVDLAAYRAGEVPEPNAGRAECAGDAPDFSCFVVQGQSHLEQTTQTDPTETREEVAVSARSALLLDGEPVLTVDDFVRLQSHSAFPVPEPNSRMTVGLPGIEATVSTGDFSRSGLQHFFPFSTERISYNFFDPMTQTSTPLDFVNRVQHDGMRTFEFQQTVPAVSLLSAMAQGFTQPQGVSDAPELSPLARTDQMTEEQRDTIGELRVNGSAEQFYTDAELAANDFAPQDRISLSPYYSVDRTIWVEPQSGLVTDRTEDVHVYLAADQQEADRMAANLDELPADRTILDTSLSWDESTRELAQSQARSDLAVLKTLEVLGLAGNTAVVFLLAGGLYWLLRRRYREHRTLSSGAKLRDDDPATAGPGADAARRPTED